MYLSRLIISNYRSIKLLDLKLSPTKNIIIGHNNAGKSNIIRALNIILGEQTPNYKKLENITPRDFFKGEEDRLFIIGEISKKDNSSFKFEDIITSESTSIKGTYITLFENKKLYEENKFLDLVNETINTKLESYKTNYDLELLSTNEKFYLKFEDPNNIDFFKFH